jgi:hypothetical protein
MLACWRVLYWACLCQQPDASAAGTPRMHGLLCDAVVSGCALLKAVFVTVQDAVRSMCHTVAPELAHPKSQAATNYTAGHQRFVQKQPSMLDGRCGKGAPSVCKQPATDMSAVQVTIRTVAATTARRPAAAPVPFPAQPGPQLPSGSQQP